ncbi:MAG: LacI family transcriptional regulator [Pseudonocardiales bacterium]|jgi:LacI family transcriptional regulator|nr:LacI family transcriptional regulator [Pseudonocardiales bacterium]
MTTIYDVAKHAGVSPATVSRVLNGHARVNPTLARRVNQATAELGFQRNAVARNLRRSRTSLWAVIISDIENPFFTSLVRGVEDVAQSAGYSVVLCNSDENLKKEADYASAAMAERMAGVIISPASERSSDVSALLEAKMPVVAIDRAIRGAQMDSVRVDNAQGAAEATKHLLAVGYRRVACITGPQRATTAGQRLKGYERAHRAAGVGLDPHLVRHANFRQQGGYEAMESLLALPEPPDAVFVANNLMTVGALACLTDHGIAIPDEMGIVGFDDIPWAQLIRPTLSVVRQPTYDVGQTAGHLLMQRIAHPTRSPSTVVLSTRLSIGHSSSRAAAPRALVADRR